MADGKENYKRDARSGKAKELLPQVRDTFNPLTPKISSVTLSTDCYTILMMLLWRIWYWINK